MVGDSSMAASPERFSSDPVLLFDGACGLCNRIVRLLLRIDRGGRLRFSPLQGPAAQRFLRANGLPTEDFDSLVFVPEWGRREGNVFLLRTDGVIAALRVVSGPAGILAGLLAVFPSQWRDAGYRLVARSRYRIFGRWQARPLARPEWGARFLE
jgi:predicted DCC family thiol-disulfide oxidoreductase YuxK